MVKVCRGERSSRRLSRRLDIIQNRQLSSLSRSAFWLLSLRIRSFQRLQVSSEGRLLLLKRDLCQASVMPWPHFRSDRPPWNNDYTSAAVSIASRTSPSRTEVHLYRNLLFTVGSTSIAITCRRSCPTTLTTKTGIARVVSTLSFN
jgi:hypothetical protein